MATWDAVGVAGGRQLVEPDEAGDDHQGAERRTPGGGQSAAARAQDPAEDHPSAEQDGLGREPPQHPGPDVNGSGAPTLADETDGQRLRGQQHRDPARTEHQDGPGQDHGAEPRDVPRTPVSEGADEHRDAHRGQRATGRQVEQHRRDGVNRLVHRAETGRADRPRQGRPAGEGHDGQQQAPGHDGDTGHGRRPNGDHRRSHRARRHRRPWCHADSGGQSRFSASRATLPAGLPPGRAARARAPARPSSSRRRPSSGRAPGAARRPPGRRRCST